MAKYEIASSRYARFFESNEAKNAFSMFINDPDIIRLRQNFWRKNFSVDPLMSQRQPDGSATFSTKVRKRNVENMLDMRAPLGDTQPRDKSGIEFYTGSIPDFSARGYVEQAMEREARARMFESLFGNDATILSAYADNIQDMVDEADQTMSNLAAQIISTGNIVYNYGAGIQSPILSVPIPASNKVTAGTVVWSDTSNCKLLDQMAKIEQDYRDRTGSTLALKWQVTRDTFYNVILKNEQVIAYVNDWRYFAEKPRVTGMAITEDMFNEAFANNQKISQIEVVEEGQKDGAVGAVHGWATNTAVLRPVGFAGTIKRAEILDEYMVKKYGSSVINEVYAGLDIYTLVNTTLNNGRFKEWHTDLLVAAVPTLDEYYDHVIVDIATADA